MKTISFWIICLFGFQELHKVSGSKPAQCIQFNKLDVDWVQFKTAQHPSTEDFHYQQLQLIEKYEDKYFICKNIENSADVNLAKSGLRDLSPGKKYNGIIFLRCNVHVLPNNFLASIKVDVVEIYFVGSKMKKIVFDLISPPKFSFKHLWIMYSLFESKAISSGAFRQNDQLTQIYIGHTNLEIVETDAFLGSNSLERLFIAYNKIRSLGKAALRGLPKLQFLDLSWNEIQSLDQEAFEYLTNLYYLNIAENKLKTLTSGIFDSLTNLLGVNLRGNDFHCDCNLQWLQDFIRDKKANNSRFTNPPINCSTPMKGNLETLNFCTIDEDAPKTKNKDQPRDCDRKKLVALNMLRKSFEKIMDDLFQKYLGQLDTDKLCLTDTSLNKQQFVPEN